MFYVKLANELYHYFYSFLKVTRKNVEWSLLQVLEVLDMCSWYLLFQDYVNL